MVAFITDIPDVFSLFAFFYYHIFHESHIFITVASLTILFKKPRKVNKASQGAAG